MLKKSVEYVSLQLIYNLTDKSLGSGIPIFEWRPNGTYIAVSGLVVNRCYVETLFKNHQSWHRIYYFSYLQDG